MDQSFRQASEHATEHSRIERQRQRFQFGECMPLKQHWQIVARGACERRGVFAKQLVWDLHEVVELHTVMGVVRIQENSRIHKRRSSSTFAPITTRISRPRASAQDSYCF